MPLNATFTEIFAEEGARHLDGARTCLARLQQGETSVPLLSDLYRHLHSIKGMAATLGVDPVTREAHAVEELVDTLRKKGTEPDQVSLLELERSLAALANLIGAQESPSSALPAPAPREAPLALKLPAARVEPERLDRLVRLATSLVSSHQRLEHELGPPSDGAALQVRHRLGSALRGLTGELLELKLVPVSTVEPLLRSAVRRWSESSGVRVELRLCGEDVHVERGLVERLFDPLGHLVRNAVSHGIEDPAERVASGKPEKGVVEVSFARRRGRLLLCVRDDGRGLDPAAVLRRAQHRGLVGDATNLTSVNARLLLLTDPRMGSSATSANEMRGRGVGLAAVRAAFEEVGARLRLESAPGRGFAAQVSLPSRRAQQEFFLVIVGGQRFALPLSAVSAVRRVDELERSALPTRVSLAGALGLRADHAAESFALVVETCSGPECLLVESVDERRELLVESLGPPLEGTAPWGGAATLAEGGLVLVVDPLAALGRDVEAGPELLPPRVG